MPEVDYIWLEKSRLLCFEELLRVVELLKDLGLRRVRITGGEPLLRQDLSLLVGMLNQVGLEDLALTTNGILLSRFAAQLLEAGLRRITVSLDTLNPETFRKLARRDELPAVLAGLRAVSSRLGRCQPQGESRVCLDQLKIDTVLLQGINSGELLDLVAFAGDIGAEIRFIEYMDVAGATRWRREDVVTQAEILQQLSAHYGEIQPLGGRGSAPAQRFRLPDGQVVGIIASVTQPFCQDCDRLRLTADGQLLTCLYATKGLDLRPWLREGRSDEEIRSRLSELWRERTDQGALERARLSNRKGFVSLGELRADPRLEMHTRGG